MEQFEVPKSLMEALNQNNLSWNKRGLPEADLRALLSPEDCEFLETWFSASSREARIPSGVFRLTLAFDIATWIVHRMDEAPYVLGVIDVYGNLSKQFGLPAELVRKLTSSLHYDYASRK
jgi:hypothetical protein